MTCRMSNLVSLSYDSRLRQKIYLVMKKQGFFARISFASGLAFRVLVGMWFDLIQLCRAGAAAVWGVAAAVGRKWVLICRKRCGGQAWCTSVQTGETRKWGGGRFVCQQGEQPGTGLSHSPAKPHTCLPVSGTMAATNPRDCEIWKAFERYIGTFTFHHSSFYFT